MIFREEIDSFLSLRLRDIFYQVVQILVFVAIALVCWRHVTLVTNCSSSMVVVISGSMEPGYYRGDLLLLHRRLDEYPVQVGDVIVYNVKGRNIPIVHRVLRLHKRSRDGKTLYLTKGDNNVYDDTHLYPMGMEWIEEDNVIGKSFAYIPRIGYITLMLAEIPMMRYLSLLLIGFFFITLEDD